MTPESITQQLHFSDTFLIKVTLARGSMRIKQTIVKQ